MKSYLVGEKIPKSEIAYFRERQKNKVFAEVMAFFEKMAIDHNLSKKDLASALGKDPAQITRWLSGPSNWTLDTVSDLLLAMNAEMDHKAHSLRNDEAKPKKPVVVLSRHGEADKTFGGTRTQSTKPITPIQFAHAK